VPGFAVVIKLSFLRPSIFRGKQQVHRAEDLSDGQDEPAIFGDDVYNDEIDLRWKISDPTPTPASLRHGAVQIPHKGTRGLHLDAPEFIAFWPVPADQDEVKLLSFAVWFSHSKAEAGGFVNKGVLRKFPSALGRVPTPPGSLSLRRWEALGRRAAFWHGVEKQKAQAGSLRLFLCLFLWD
jgi:hypothetical protein